MKGKTYLPFGAGILVTAFVLIALQMKLDIDWGAQAQAAREKTEALIEAGKHPQNLFTPAESESVKTPITETQIFLAEVDQESQKIGRTTNSPDKFEAELNRWAQSLTPERIRDLREVIFLGTHKGDEVALALDLLGRSDLHEAQEALLEYVLKGPSVSMREQSTFQLLALEGLIDQTARLRSPQALTRIQKESNDADVVRRSQQALQALEGKAPWPQETDQQQLQDRLEK